jgi:Cytochrome P460
MARKTPTMAAAFGAVGVLAALAPAGAGGDLVAFPRDYRNGVMYTSHDNAEASEFREFYVPPEALDVVRKGQPLPSGTVITLVRYDVQRDAGGNPVKDVNGRFIKIAAVKAYRVMEKRTGWGTGYPDSLRNGKWEYQAFLPDGKTDDKVDLGSSFQCHKNGDRANFMFTAEDLVTGAKVRH